MRWQPLPIVGGAYQDDTRPWSAQDTINFIPVQAERNGTRTPAMLRCAPGFATFSASSQSAPCRGLHNVEGTLYGVIGDKLYTWALDGGATALGSIPGVERVSMAHNQIAGGNQLAIAANNSGYIYDTVAETLTQITDEGFPGALYFAFIDSYIVGVDPSRNFIFNSALADATSYNTLDRAQAEAQPDKLMGIAVTHDELWVFGERTIQPFTDTGAAQAPFESNSNTVIEVGCASGHTIVNMDNSLFWLGNDGIVYRANGYTPQRVSTHPVEQAIGRCNRNAAFAFTFEDRGHKAYYLTFPDGETWGYDAASGEWHRRKSYGLDRWRIADLVYWNGHWIGGDYVNGKLYVLSWDCQQEDGQILERRRIFGPVTDDQNPIIVNGIEIAANVGEKPGLSYDNLLNGPLVISGDLPSGATGVAIDFTYGMTGGVKPYGPTTITSGALPTGLSMDNAGHVTGTVTAGGNYAWQVGATDAIGVPASLDDSAEFYVPATFSPTRNNNTSLSSGNTIATAASGTSCGVATNAQKTSGKWYLEFTLNTGSTNATSIEAQVSAGPNANPILANGGGNSQTFQWNADGSYYAGGVFHASGLPAWSTVGSVIGLAFDAATLNVWIRNATGWLLGGDPENGASPIATLTNHGVGACAGFAVAGIAGQAPAIKINTGQSAFAYGAPAGFSPLSSP